MAVINPSMVAAIIGALEGRQTRRLQSKLSRRPTFGDTLSRSLAAGLGAVPGQAAGSYIGGQIDLANRRTIAGEERAYQDQPVDVPGNPLAAPVPRRFLGEFLADDMARERLHSERAYQSEPVTMPGLAEPVPRSLVPSAVSLANTQSRDRPVPLTGADRLALGIPEPIQPGPEGILAVPGGPLSPDALSAFNADAGARDTMPLSEFEARYRAKGDLSTAAIRKGELDERERHNRAMEENVRSGQATQERIAHIRALKGYDKAPLERLKEEFRSASRALEEVEDAINKASRDPYLFGEAKREELERLTLQRQVKSDEKAAAQQAWAERSIGPSEASPTQGAPAPAPSPAPAPAGRWMTPPAEMDEDQLTRALNTAQGADLDALIEEAQRRVGAGAGR